jgi:hypothetical protein
VPPGLHYGVLPPGQPYGILPPADYYPPLPPAYHHNPLWSAAEEAASAQSTYAAPLGLPLGEPVPEHETELERDRRTLVHIYQIYGRAAVATIEEQREDLSTYGYNLDWLIIIKRNLEINHKWHPPMSEFVTELINFLEQPQNL